MIGETIKHFKVSAKLGSGGMGEVYLAEDTTLERQVALKFLPASVSDNPDAKQRLIREAKAASKLDHPNIVTVHGIEESDGRLFIVMAHVSGTTIDKYVASLDRQSESVIALACQIADGLAHAHVMGIVHRDLKPGNILVDERGRVRILDFGVARIQGASRLTQTGSTVGTLAYTAPELVQGQEASACSDIFSYGVVLYQLLTGVLPFEADHEAALLYSIMNEDPRSMAGCDPPISAELQAVVMRCLAKDPDQRFPDCRSLHKALEECGPNSVISKVETARVEKPSIAVLPFVNMSRDEENEYFSDGLAEELLNVLAKLSGLRVSARASSFHFKGKDVPLADVGKALNVATVLDGSVRKSGNRVRISVQLVKVPDGYHLWSETYDRTLDDIFAVQDDIAQAVVTELRRKLLGEDDDSNKSKALKAEISKAARGRGDNAESHRLVLQARHLIDGQTREQLTQAIGYLLEAVDIEPGNARAWTELGRAFAQNASLGWTPVNDGYRQAREAVEKALSIQPELADAHALLGRIQMLYDWNWRAAEASYDRALEVEPDNSTALIGAGIIVRDLGDYEKAIDLFCRALEVDPLCARAYSNLGMTYLAAKQLKEAEIATRKALEIAPLRSATRDHLSMIILAQGRMEEALEVAAQETDEAFRLYAMAIIQYAIGQQSESDDSLRLLIDKYAKGAGFQIAEVYAARGEIDAAFEWLERSYDQHDTGLSQLLLSDHLHALHSDPRWPGFVKKVGFEA